VKRLRRSARRVYPGAPAPRVELLRSNEGTLHAQIYRALVERITRGDVRAGDRMPTESELMTSYSVGRATARRALDELRRANLVERRPGRGTFVSAPRLQASIPHLHSITTEIEELGYTPGSELVSARVVRADPIAAQQLNIERSDPVMQVKRLRTADGQPFYFAVSALNLVRFPHFRDVDFSSPSLSLYRLFEEVTGRKVARVTQWLAAVAATGEAAGHLNVADGHPLLEMERVLFVDGDIPVESVRAWFIGGTYRFYSELYAPGFRR
jgi:GntR family transcriptional regulator